MTGKMRIGPSLVLAGFALFVAGMPSLAGAGPEFVPTSTLGRDSGELGRTRPASWTLAGRHADALERPEIIARGPEGLQQIGITPGYGDPGWTILVVANFFLANFEGNATVGGLDSEIFAGRDVVLNNQESGVLAHVEFFNEVSKLAVLFEVDYLELQRVELEQGTTTQFDFKQVSTELGVAYQLNELGGTFSFDVLGGGRFTRFDLEAAANNDSLSGRPVNIRPSWLDPFIGGRFATSVTGGLVAGLRADVGGFGVGSNLTYNIQGGAGLLTGPGMVSVQYKYIDTDYEEGSGFERFEWKVAKHGILLGFGLMF